MPTFDSSLVWFRRDLRISDHAALYYALRQSKQVHCVFVYDRDILDALLADGLQADRRIDFIMASMADRKRRLAEEHDHWRTETRYRSGRFSRRQPVYRRGVFG